MAARSRSCATTGGFSARVRAPAPCIAGKARPRDGDGKRFVQALLADKTAPGFGASVGFLDDYDLRMARYLVRGWDVWVSLPRPPLQASVDQRHESARSTRD